MSDAYSSLPTSAELKERSIGWLQLAQQEGDAQGALLAAQIANAYATLFEASVLATLVGESRAVHEGLEAVHQPVAPAHG